MKLDDMMSRIAYAEFVQEVLRKRAPFLFSVCMALLLLVMLAPMLLVLLLLCPAEVVGLKGLLYVPLVLFGCLAGLGLCNLCMPPLHALCQWRLRDDFPRGLDMSFYLGHAFTLVCLLGFGGLTLLLAFLLNL